MPHLSNSLKLKIVTVDATMQSSMFRFGFLFVVLVAGNAATVLELDRQECRDRLPEVTCNLALSCNIRLIASRCEKSCGTCSEDVAVTTTTAARKFHILKPKIHESLNVIVAACEDSFPQCNMLTTLGPLWNAFMVRL